jgi:hypothetical protein
LAGTTLASGKIAVRVTPKEKATAYLAGNSLVNSLAAAIDPVLGCQFADFLATRELSLTLNWKSPLKEVSFHTLNFQHRDFFSLSFVIGLHS